MRRLWMAAIVFLSACGQEPAPSAETPDRNPPLTLFNDNGCIAFLMLQRTAIREGRAQGDIETLQDALATWRTQAASTLSPEELLDYEERSLREHERTSPANIAERAAACVADVPG